VVLLASQGIETSTHSQKGEGQPKRKKVRAREAMKKKKKENESANNSGLLNKALQVIHQFTFRITPGTR